MGLPDLNKDPGEGNTNLRAYIAAVLGPRRIAHGARRAFKLTKGKAVLVCQNDAPERETVFFECWLQQGTTGLGGGGAFILFSSSEDMGNAVIVDLAQAMPGQLNNHFSAVLLPQDELYAQLLSDAAGASLDAVSITASKVTV